MAAWRLRYPPVATWPERWEVFVTFPRILLLIFHAASDGYLAAKRAAVPDTWGVAMEVPFSSLYPPSW